jgi:hypothetical protein
MATASLGLVEGSSASHDVNYKGMSLGDCSSHNYMNKVQLSDTLKNHSKKSRSMGCGHMGHEEEEPDCPPWPVIIDFLGERISDLYQHPHCLSSI